MSQTARTGQSASLLRMGTGPGLLLLLLAAILGVRVLGLALSNAELFFDEAQYWAWAQEPAFGYFTKPPLIAWLIGASTALCGDTPFCVRITSPILHMATSLVVYVIALRLFDRRTAFWSALVYNLMPGLSVSATLMSTDVPLLIFWTLGLLAIVHHVQKPSLGAGLALGVAIGLGLNAKYAMVYLPLCFVVYAFFASEGRAALKHPGTIAGLAVAVLLIVPNIMWNFGHGFATFEHTRENAGWGGRFPNFMGVLEFVGIQAAIISPVPFAAFSLSVLGRNNRLVAFPKRLLLCHSLPVFALIIVQALISKANGNWAATAFPAAVILATATMLTLDWRRGMQATLVIGGICLAAVSFAGAFAGVLTAGPAGSELGKMVGWGDLAANVKRIADANGARTVVFDRRGLTASMIYELRDSDLDVRAWLPSGAPPRDHFELTRPWQAADSGPVVLFTIGKAAPPESLAARAAKIETFPTRAFIARREGWEASAYRID